MNLFTPTTRDARVEKLMGMLPNLVGSWDVPFQDILTSDLMYCTLEEVFQRATVTKVLPASGNMFRAFKECPVGQLKVIFIGQDPYHQVLDGIPVADGLAFSCGNTKREQPSITFLFDEIQKTAYHYLYTRNPDLTRWANQGILMLNTALTVEQAKPDSHTEIWKDLMRELIKRISSEYENLIFVFFGRKAQQFKTCVSGKHHKIDVVHPAAAAHRGGVWDSENLFPRINEILSNSLKQQIVW